jgi:hypothetical protein
MPIVTTNFIAGRMNKSVDERLLPPGEYIDALNVRLGSTETTEIGAVENAKGNSRLTYLAYNGEPLSINATCIGAYEDGVRETIYWFIHDATNLEAAGGIVDMVVSYNTTSQVINYHIVTEDLLNFDPKHLITGINLLDDLLFWTDDINPPRYINIDRNYPLPIANIDQIIEEDISVIVKIPGFENIVNNNVPLAVPKITLLNVPGGENYIENKFLCFAYRYRYLDGQYSATSLFSLPAFATKPFRFDTKNYNNSGMQNLYNGINVEYSTGSSRVVQIDLLFKESNSNNINVIERFVKKDYGWPDNTVQSYVFTNSKIYTVIGADELLRQYDNVPRFAKAQIIQGNRLMYGNYIDGYNFTSGDSGGTNIALNYTTSIINTIISSEELPFASLNSGLSYTIDPADTKTYDNNKVTFDLSSTVGKLKKNSYISFSFNLENQVTVVGAGQSTNPAWIANNQFKNSSFTLNLNITLDADYSSTYAFVSSPLFQDAIGTILNTNFKPIADSADGNSLTDYFNNELSSPAVSYVFNKINSSITSSTVQQGFLITGASPGVNTFSLQVIAMQYQNIDSTPLTTNIYEYFRFISAEGGFSTTTDTGSLHSNRDYETGIVYSDDYGRSSTVLVSERNTVYIEPGDSDKQNNIQVAVNSLAPYWAERYKFVVKPSLGNYETIYSNFYYVRPSDNMVFFKLEGDNANKVSKGQTLIVKADVSGPVSRLVTVEVLDISAESSDFLNADNELGENSNQLSGLYMQMKNQNFDISIPEDSIIEYGEIVQKSPTRGCTNNRKIAYPCFTQDVVGVGSAVTNYDIPAGSTITIKVTAFRNDTYNGNSCQEILWEWDQQYVSSDDYTDVRRWWEGDNINPEIASPGNLSDETPIRYSPTVVAPSNAPRADILDTKRTADNVTCASFEVYFQFIQAASALSTDPLYLGVSSGLYGCNRTWPQSDRTSDLHVELIVERTNTLMVFESEAVDANTELYYDASESYPITQPQGFHMSGTNTALGDQNQTATQDAVVNLDFQDCFVFGNGVESFKIKDSLAGRAMVLGQRVLAVSNQDYKEADRFEGITYSGVYSSNSGLNNLNEFNLGLVNFKDCETSFGPIQKMHARETDILVLQEDRITYVLSSKNLISDSTGGGVIASVPQVLGTQIARIEEYGISYNPESFVSWGSEMYFTDVKRGAVIKLRGTSMSNDSLEVISNNGMRSYFRDQFFDSITTQKLGGYDPYMNEYVLGMNCKSVPLPPEISNCGYSFQKTGLEANETIVSTIDYGQVIGQCNISYNIDTLPAPAGSITISVLWNGITTTSGTLTGAGTFSFDKTLNTPLNAVVTITGVTRSSFSIIANCPTEVEIEVIKVVMNSPVDSGDFIHTEYKWNDSVVVSPIDSELATFGSSSVVASNYRTQVGIRSLGVFPYSGTNITLRSNKVEFDNYDWVVNSDNFKYLSSNTLYANTESDISALLAASTTIANASVTNPSPGLYQGIIPSLSLPISNQYLYVIYDYRETSCQEFCYDASSSAAACCDCTVTYTSYNSSSVQQNITVACGQPLIFPYYHTGAGALPAVGDFVYSSSNGEVGTTLALGIYRISVTSYIRVNQFGLVTEVTTCPTNQF